MFVPGKIMSVGISLQRIDVSSIRDNTISAFTHVMAIMKVVPTMVPIFKNTESRIISESLRGQWWSYLKARTNSFRAAPRQELKQRQPQNSKQNLTALYVSVSNPLLLQTAKALTYKPGNSEVTVKPNLKGLKLANYHKGENNVDIDILVRSDQYWTYWLHKIRTIVNLKLPFSSKDEHRKSDFIMLFQDSRNAAIFIILPVSFVAFTYSL